MKIFTAFIKKFKSSGNISGCRYFNYLFSGVLLTIIFSLFAKIQCFERYETIPLDSINTSDVCYFDFGKWELKSESYPTLEKVFNILKENPDFKIEMTGYTDNIGTDEFNYELSAKRSQAVKDYLVSLGCKEENIILIAKGKHEPVNDNITEIDRAMNRRVVFNLLVPQKIEEEKDIHFVNSSFPKLSRTELTGEISIRDTNGFPVENIKEDDITAVLKWGKDEAEDSTSGSVHFIPIDDKKKLAFSLTMDYSGSMYGNDKAGKDTEKSDKILAMENAVKTFIRELKSNMYCKIVKFGFEVNEIIRYSKSKEVIERAVDNFSFPRGGTALYSSIYKCMLDTTFENNPTVMKTVIAFTDGMENSSGKITIDSIYNLSSRKNIKIFTVGLFADIPGFEPELIVRKKGVEDLQNIAAKCSGFFYRADNPEQLSNIYKSIFTQILSSYQVSILWNTDKLPPKGTKVKAVVKLNINGKIRILYKDYIIE